MHPPPAFDPLPDLLHGLHARNPRDPQAPPLTLARLVQAGVDRLPLPGAGHTLQRWRQLAAVAGHDLALAKLFEGHTDALAIQAELGGRAAPAGSLWGTWCAEPPQARLRIESDGPAGCRLQGTKAWCSGASQLTHAVVSGWDAQDRPCLAMVALDARGVTLTGEGWHAVGMADTASIDVRFDDVPAVPLGKPGDYTGRPGFWQGGAGIAACWWGGARAIGEMARASILPRGQAHALAHLGAIDVALVQSAALLRECAQWIDAHPRGCAQAWALRVRLAAETAADAVMRHAGRALGAGPLCRDPRFARAMADLPVFLRQSHAERDLASLASAPGGDAEEGPWPL